MQNLGTREAMCLRNVSNPTPLIIKTSMNKNLLLDQKSISPSMVHGNLNVTMSCKIHL